MHMTTVRIRDDDKKYLNENNIGYTEAIKMFCEERKTTAGEEREAIKKHLEAMERKLVRNSEVTTDMLKFMRDKLNKEEFDAFISSLPNI